MKYELYAGGLFDELCLHAFLRKHDMDRHLEVFKDGRLSLEYLHQLIPVVGIIFVLNNCADVGGILIGKYGYVFNVHVVQMVGVNSLVQPVAIFLVFVVYELFIFTSHIS